MRRVAAVIAALATAVGVSVAAPATASAAPFCEPVATFGVGGFKDPQGNVYAPYVRTVPYSASIWPLTPTTYDASVAEGAANTVAAVNDYAAQCSGPIVVKGYSQGARVAGDALEILGNGPHAHRISGVLYADPKHPGGIEDTFRGGIIPGMTMTGARQGFNVPVRSECNYGRDAVCDLPNPFLDPAGAYGAVAGYLGTGHHYDVNN